MNLCDSKYKPYNCVKLTDLVSVKSLTHRVKCLTFTPFQATLVGRSSMFFTNFTFTFDFDSQEGQKTLKTAKLHFLNFALKS